MPTKSTKAGKPYKVTGKKFVWSPLDEDDKRGTLPDVAIPLRLKLGLIRRMGDRDLDAGTMFEMLEAIVPGQANALDDMDVNDFVAMFTAWQEEYQALNGATPGE